MVVSENFGGEQKEQTPIPDVDKGKSSQSNEPNKLLELISEAVSTSVTNSTTALEERLQKLIIDKTKEIAEQNYKQWEHLSHGQEKGIEEILSALDTKFIKTNDEKQEVKDLKDSLSYIATTISQCSGDITRARIQLVNQIESGSRGYLHAISGGKTQELFETSKMIKNIEEALRSLDILLEGFRLQPSSQGFSMQHGSKQTLPPAPVQALVSQTQVFFIIPSEQEPLFAHFIHNLFNKYDLNRKNVKAEIYKRMGKDIPNIPGNSVWLFCYRLLNRFEPTVLNRLWENLRTKANEKQSIPFIVVFTTKTEISAHSIKSHVPNTFVMTFAQDMSGMDTEEKFIESPQNINEIQNLVKILNDAK